MALSPDIVKELRVENSLLREQLRQAIDALRGTDDWVWSKRLGITTQIETLLRCLYKHYPNTCGHEMLYTAIYIHRIDDWPQSRILQVQMCKLRRIIPRNCIETVWGRGYRLLPAGKKWIDAQIRKQHNGNKG